MDKLNVPVTFDPLGRYLNLRSSRVERRMFLRPMRSGEIVDAALTAFRNIGYRILIQTLLPSVLVTIGILFVSGPVLKGFFFSTSKDIWSQVYESGVVLGIGVLVSVPLISLGVVYINTLTCVMASDFVAGNLPNAQSAIQISNRYIGRMLLLTVRQFLTVIVAYGIAFGISALSAFVNVSTRNENIAAALVAFLAILGWVAAIIYSLWFLASSAIDAPALVIENLTVKQAMKRGSQLLTNTMRYGDGGKYSVVSIWLLMGLMLLILPISFSSLYALIGGLVPKGIQVLPVYEMLFYAVPTLIAVWFLVPVWGIASTLIYFERRVRLEGYDVEVLAQDVWRTNKDARFQL